MSTCHSLGRDGAARARALFICGSLNQTSQLCSVARYLTELDCQFTPFGGGPLVGGLRRLGLVESTIGGNKLRGRCLAYLNAHGLPVDLDADGTGYDLIVACTDLGLPRAIRRARRLLVVQEGMVDPITPWADLVRACGLPLWAASTVWTGSSGCYDRFCVASEGYRDLFIARGAPADKLVVTGIPNFDDCARYRDNALPYRGYVLVCTSDLRETLRWDDRARFIAHARQVAAGRPIHFKLHPNENLPRAYREIARHCPGAVVHCEGSAEALVANCDVLLTQYSSLAYVGLALGKEVHSYFDSDELRRLLPIQNQGRSAEHIAVECRRLLAAPQVELGSRNAATGGSHAPAVQDAQGARV